MAGIAGPTCRCHSRLRGNPGLMGTRAHSHSLGACPGHNGADGHARATPNDSPLGQSGTAGMMPEAWPSSDQVALVPRTPREALPGSRVSSRIVQKSWSRKEGLGPEGPASHPCGPLRQSWECSIVWGEFPLPDSASCWNPEMGRRFVQVATPKGLLAGGGNGAQQIAAWWQEVEAAATSGRLPRARRFLRWILSCFPEDEDAWLWMARLATSHDAQLLYLRQAYSFHPNSVRVQAALRKARSQQLELAVGDLRGGRSVLGCLPNERRNGNGNRRTVAYPTASLR